MPKSRIFSFTLTLAVLCALAITAIDCRSSQPPASVPADSGEAREQSLDFTQSGSPKPVERTVPAGTIVHVELLETVASNTSRPGDSFQGRLAQDVVVGGEVVIPAGAKVSGTVKEAVPLKKIGGRPKLALEFTSLEPPAGDTRPIKAYYAVEGKSETKKDAATIGGAAAGGALLGRIIGHKKGEEAKGTAVGGAVGAVTGTAIAAATKGDEIVIPSGEVIQIRLETPVEVSA